MSGILAIIIAEIIWGSAPPIFKYSLQGVPPFTLAFIRFFTASFIFMPFAYMRWKRLTTIQLVYILLGSLVGVVINVSAFFVGLELAPSINVHMISAAGPLVLYALSIFVLHEKPHAQVFRGMIFAFVGVLVIFLAPLFRDGFSTGSGSVRSVLIGNFLFMIAMVGGVFYAVINKKIIKTVDSTVIMSLQFFVGSVAFIPMMVRELKDWSFASLNNAGWVGIIYGIFFSSALAYFLLNYALKRISAQQIGVFEYMKPVIAVLVAIPLLSEFPDVYFIIGSVLIFVGVYISERHPHFQRIHTKIGVRG
ncbi:hypothetical protein CO051_07330 [Candidatus Roizmanbacteria bacterium CG_4_9_14_0_2_um_filter_39_13]|uniref:EamA domain-containing protein n=2 Tax=Candidatus Roizmaniibacteriota TaxID=1752723 RepID=A0A2M8EW90_9BACT|nr:MAG: hypothetical protein COY15_00280 [Candidatus Roizmanbacteria bacterium CG_4_10_14_0_2_um_filter_39_12]PJC30132.1 MAG: hypothetical protein CO051_07330 [Candidatus Roizmanbacteria bacterium CG_4_9_14_0_2_um_filter_39_13]PJE61537.1 MAG: hypothetical protein COU87_04035 [Candidatus Roizmanbacteria bacterium CG10_big_fil_rev_8_21_14_0_10_39_12]